MHIRKRLKFYVKTVFIVLLSLCYSCKEKTSSDTAHAFTNELIHETSPYLLQHAHNPVNWQAWSPELFEKAQKDNKLVLISIGYSSCHWCHVMEKETFEDEEVAKMMNENFINIKVDREERPDVDQVYMTAIQLIKGNGGWPLNVITLPNGKPLYAGTYHTKEQWSEILLKINQMYTENPGQANEYADQLSAGIQETNLIEPSVEFEKLTKDALNEGLENWKEYWDLELGGNSGHQKFMMANTLSYLLDNAVLTENEEALTHVKNTLDKMAQGGLYDHIGGGFYRYSTDNKWKIPHFEKMLYDNAQAISLYVKAYKVFKDPSYKRVVEQTVAFLEREMKNPKGGYFATLDADSDGEEGKFYVWTIEELKKVLGNDFDLFSSYFNVKQENVWENNTYILFTDGNDSDFLVANEISENEFISKKLDWQTKLLEAKQKRVRPTTDDKIISSWNALLINGFIDAATAFSNETYLNRAISTFDFIKENSYSNKELQHSYKDGNTRKEGFIEDYALLTDASLNLYKATLDNAYLRFSETLTKTVIVDFADEPSGMFRFRKDNQLISKIIKTDDGAIASPNSVMANNLFQLGHINYNQEYLKKAKTMLTTMLPKVTESTSGYANWSNLLLQNTHPYFEVVVVGKDAKQLVKKLQEKHLPNALIIGSTSESEAPLFKDRYFEEKTLIYVCQNSTCKLPVETVEAAIEQMKNF